MLRQKFMYFLRNKKSFEVITWNRFIYWMQTYVSSGSDNSLYGYRLPTPMKSLIASLLKMKQNDDKNNFWKWVDWRVLQENPNRELNEKIEFLTRVFFRIVCSQIFRDSSQLVLILSMNGTAKFYWKTNCFTSTIKVPVHK